MIRRDGGANDSADLLPGDACHLQCPFRCLCPQREVRFAVGKVPFPDAGACGDPFIAGLHDSCHIVICHGFGRDTAASSADADADVRCDVHMGFLAFVLLHHLVYPFSGRESTYSHENPLYTLENRTKKQHCGMHSAAEAFYHCSFFVFFSGNGYGISHWRTAAQRQK